MKRILKPLVPALLTAAALAPLGLGQSPAQEGQGAQEAAAAPLPSARAVIDRYVEATGAAAVVEKTSSMKLTGKVGLPAMGISGTFENFRTKPNKSYLVSNLEQMGKSEQGYNGEVAWMSHPMMGQQILEGSQRMGFLMQADYKAGLMLDADYDLLEVLGREEFEGKDCYALKSVYKAPDDEDEAKKTAKVRTATSYFDVESGLMVGRKSVQPSPMGDTPVTNIMSDYKKFGEYLMPAKTVQKVNGMEIEITFETVEFDKVEDSVYDLPDAIRALLKE